MCDLLLNEYYLAGWGKVPSSLLYISGNFEVKSGTSCHGPFREYSRNKATNTYKRDSVRCERKSLTKGLPETP